jgi:hypothetical protein
LNSNTKNERKLFEVPIESGELHIYSGDIFKVKLDMFYFPIKVELGNILAAMIVLSQNFEIKLIKIPGTTDHQIFGEKIILHYFIKSIN